MKNLSDILIEKIKELRSPIVVGIDPILERIPNCYKSNYIKTENELEAIGEILYNFGRDIIDIAYKYVPCIKLQIAFYEAYGFNGIKAFEKTVRYAKSKDLLVIVDGKRCDIEEVAGIYAKGYFGKVPMLSKEDYSYDVDFITITPYLGNHTMNYFVEESIKNNKGVFVVVKSSNYSSADIQNRIDEKGSKIYMNVANYVKEQAEKNIGENGYSSIGGIVGATFPSEALISREIMEKSILLLPGYGTQGATAIDAINCFDKNGLGAIVCSSRTIDYAYEKKYNKEECTLEQHLQEIEQAILNMRDDIIKSLEENKKYL